MTNFFETIFASPVSVFTYPFMVVAAYWIFAALGGVDLDGFDADVDLDADGEGEGGLGGLLALMGLQGVPLSVSISLIITIGWITSIAAVEVFGDEAVANAALVVGGSVLLGFAVAVQMAKPLRRLYDSGHVARRSDFLGRKCTIRTENVTGLYGQAEARAEDGSTAVIQVRSPDGIGLVAGAAALIHGYDRDGEFFWVTPLDAVIDPDLA